MKIKTFLASVGLVFLAGLSLTSCGNDAGAAKANLKKYSNETTKEAFALNLATLEEKYTLKRSLNTSTFDYEYNYTLADLYLAEYESTNVNATMSLNGKAQKAKENSKSSEILQYDVDTDCILETKVTDRFVSSPEEEYSVKSNTKTQSQVEKEESPYQGSEGKAVYEYNLISKERERDYRLYEDSIGEYRHDLVNVYSKIRNTISSMRSLISLDAYEENTENDYKISTTLNIKYFKDDNVYTLEYEKIREISYTNSDKTYSSNTKTIEKGLIQIVDEETVLCVSKVKTTGESTTKENGNDIKLKYTNESFNSLEFKNSSVTIEKQDEKKFTSINIGSIM